MAGDFFPMNDWLVWVAILWSLPWKGCALWRAARRGHMWWFIVILLVNTVGLLDMIYLFFVSERKRVPSRRREKDGKA